MFYDRAEKIERWCIELFYLRPLFIADIFKTVIWV